MVVASDIQSHWAAVALQARSHGRAWEALALLEFLFTPTGVVNVAELCICGVCTVKGVAFAFSFWNAPFTVVPAHTQPYVFQNGCEKVKITSKRGCYIKRTAPYTAIPFCGHSHSTSQGMVWDV